MKKSSSVIPVVIIVLLVLCCCLIVALGGAGFAIFKWAPSLPSLVRLTPNFIPGATPTTYQITGEPVNQIQTETLKQVEQVVVPENDLAELACRFKAVCDVPPTLAPPPHPFSAGTQQTFWVNDEDTHSYFQAHATLRYVTPHSYFWVEDSVSYNEQDMKSLMDTFENKIYPTDRQFLAPSGLPEWMTTYISIFCIRAAWDPMWPAIIIPPMNIIPGCACIPTRTRCSISAPPNHSAAITPMEPWRMNSSI